MNETPGPHPPSGVPDVGRIFPPAFVADVGRCTPFFISSFRRALMVGADVFCPAGAGPRSRIADSKTYLPESPGTRAYRCMIISR